jgi:hypothetical protein
MTTFDFVMFLAPLVVGFGVGYLTNRRQGETPQQAVIDTIAQMFEKYLGQPQPATSPDSQPPAPGDVTPFLDLIHKLIDKLGEKKV